MINIERLKIEIGERLKAAREERNMSQEEVAAQLGLSKVGYGSLERGKNLIGLQHLIALVYIFQKPITFFLPAAAVTDIERNNPLLDPKLRELIEVLVALWPRLDDAAQEAIRDVVVALDEIVRNQRGEP